MALEVTNLKRVFKLKKNGKEITLEDIEGLSPDEVMKHYIAEYPELTNASVKGPEVKGATATYNFSTSAGTKG